MRRAFAFAAAASADATLGDAPNALHPVALLGQAAQALRRRAPVSEVTRTRYGTAVALALPAAAALSTAGVCRTAARTHPLAGHGVEAATLVFASSLRTLLWRAEEVRTALAGGDLPEARRLLGRHLVSRHTSALPPDEVAAAAIESVAENLCDGVVAPWLAFALAGAPGAAAYRAANTLDAMWGYRTPEFEALGRGAARLDDVLNLVPARVTALALVAAAATRRWGAGCDARRAVTTWRRDRALTESPNAGHPMAAMAGALGVRLGKAGVYELGPEFRAPDHEDIGRAIRLARGAALITACALGGVLLQTGRAR